MSGGHDQFRVDSAALMAHAGEVDRIGDGLTTTAEPGQAVQTGNDVYGQLCQFVPALLNGLQQKLVEGLTTASGCAYDTADSLRSVAAAYDAADSSAADHLRNTR
jgi:hypothetical protein